MGCHFFHPIQKCMFTIATMDLEQKDEMSTFMAKLFWSLLQAAVRKYVLVAKRGSVDDVFDPEAFVSDGQGSIWTGIRCSFGAKDGSVLEGREQTFLFHYR